MTSTKEIEKGLEDVKESALSELPAARRAQAVVQFQAAGKDDVTEDLYETAPVKTYETTDLEFTKQVERYKAEALYALWELETAAWRFLYEARARVNPETGIPDEEEEEEEGDAEAIAAEFLADYRAWTRYATENVGVSLQEFLIHTLKPEGEATVKRVDYAAGLADGSAFVDDGSDVDAAEVGWSADTVTLDGSEYTVDELAEWKYQQIADGIGGK